MKAPDVKYIEHIPVAPKKGLILTRLGYWKGTTTLSEKDNLLIDTEIKRALLLCNARGAFCYCRIIEHAANKVVLENGTELISEKLASFLKHSSDVVLMASTLGREISYKTAQEIKNGNVAAGLILDATASVAVDAVLDWMMSLINKTIVIKGKVLTRRRFSPGYGDLDLFYQSVIYDILELEKMDIAITDRFMLEPEKSVIAIAGIEVSHD
ncbi:MAG: methionine synthase [Desulfotomaculaceae bacterium]|nr:methionine synthase [Desulfotomaculaceae bacterium]